LSITGSVSALAGVRCHRFARFLAEAQKYNVKVALTCGAEDAELVAREMGIKTEEIQKFKPYEVDIGIRRILHDYAIRATHSGCISGGNNETTNLYNPSDADIARSNCSRLGSVGYPG
jgi:hypothetical protein